MRKYQSEPSSSRNNREPAELMSSYILYINIVKVIVIIVVYIRNMNIHIDTSGSV